MAGDDRAASVVWAVRAAAVADRAVRAAGRTADPDAAGARADADPVPDGRVAAAPVCPVAAADRRAG
ncbi:hypothetical protein GCM10027088_29650 [Nocardia goodfellowii]